MAITAQTTIQTEFGPFNVTYHKVEGKELAAFSYGDIAIGEPLVRFHSACLFGEAFHSLHCDCAQQLAETMKMIVTNGNGTIVYVAYEEGRGIGLENKIKAMEVERTEMLDTIDAFKRLGFDPDPRDFGIKTEVLKDLNVSKTIKSFLGNPRKRKSLEDAGFVIGEELEIKSEGLNELAVKERQAKKDKMGYSHGN